MRNYLGVVVFLLALVSGWAIANKDCEAVEVNTNIEADDNDTKRSISQKLRAHGHLSIEKQIKLFYSTKKDSLEFFNFENEEELTMYGYGLLWSEQVDDAIAIFKLLVAEFPESANTYDSLGEAYLAKGEKELSLKNYEKALRMNPENFLAEDQIERIKNPNLIPLTPKEKFAKVYSVQDYRSDLDLLGKKLVEIHPNALKFTTEAQFKKLIEEKKANITRTTTFAEFDWYCQEIIAAVNCSHTGAGSFQERMEMMPPGLRFPLEVRYLNDKLYVIDPLENGRHVNKKDEILAINNVPVSDVVDEIYATIVSQGYVRTSKRHDFNSWASGMIPYALGFPKTYKVQLQGKESDVFLEQSKKVMRQVIDNSIPRCNNGLCFEFLDGGRSAVMTISTFNYYPWNNLSEFTDFVDASFKKMNEKGTQNLVFDLRFNGGGSPESSMHLLKYLVDEPFTYFVKAYNGVTGPLQPFENGYKGKSYFIIDGRGKSTTGHFMSFVKKFNLGVTVGEELGSNHFCTGGQAVCRLPKTKLVYYVANVTSKSTVTNLPDEVGILPDHYFTQGIDDYINGVDAVKEFTLKMLK